MFSIENLFPLYGRRYLLHISMRSDVLQRIATAPASERRRIRSLHIPSSSWIAFSYISLSVSSGFIMPASGDQLITYVWLLRCRPTDGPEILSICLIWSSKCSMRHSNELILFCRFIHGFTFVGVSGGAVSPDKRRCIYKGDACQDDFTAWQAEL